MRDKYILAVDLGTSGPKVALVSLQGEIVASTFYPVSLTLLPAGGAEQDPEEWWQAVLRGAHELIGRGVVPADRIAAISCTAQWSGTVPVDRSGNALGEAIIWMDSRGAPYVRQATSGPLRVSGYGIGKLFTWLRLTAGIPGHSGKDSIAHILYLKHRNPRLYAQTWKFLEPKDYLNLRFTGEVAASYDSIALHWVTDNRNISAVRYHPKLLAMAGLDGERLPDLKRAVDILGPVKKDVARELGLPTSVPVVVGTPDVQSAALGSGAVQDYAGHLYIGTSSWLSCHVPFKKTDLFRNIASLPSAIPQRYFVANEQETAGACLTYLKDRLFFPQDELTPNPSPDGVYQSFDRIAASAPPGSAGVIFTPWLNGERTPVEDRTVRSTFLNQSLQTTRSHLVRAVYEGVAFNSRWLLRSVERFIKRRFEALHMIGGGAKSEVWCQIHADVLDRVIRQVDDPIHANVRGAAWLAAVAIGELRFEDIPERVKIAKVFHPNPQNRCLYDDMFEIFLEAYRKNKRLYRRLDRLAKARGEKTPERKEDVR